MDKLLESYAENALLVRAQSALALRRAATQRAIAEALFEVSCADTDAPLRDEEAALAIAEADSCEEQARIYEAEATRLERAIEIFAVTDYRRSSRARPS